mmetsp:Transcript_28592/g.68142  ORF Transcript_28592/g.68142 Transcript_28592/m.68142 type:complete len:218 (-) Transcript_28592:864-1517(-)
MAPPLGGKCGPLLCAARACLLQGRPPSCALGGAEQPYGCGRASGIVGGGAGTAASLSRSRGPLLRGNASGAPGWEHLGRDRLGGLQHLPDPPSRRPPEGRRRDRLGWIVQGFRGVQVHWWHSPSQPRGPRRRARCPSGQLKDVLRARLGQLQGGARGVVFGLVSGPERRGAYCGAQAPLCQGAAPRPSPKLHSWAPLRHGAPPSLRRWVCARESLCR